MWRTIVLVYKRCLVGVIACLQTVLCEDHTSSFLSLLSTVAWYIIPLARHSPSNGQLDFVCGGGGGGWWVVVGGSGGGWL